MSEFLTRHHWLLDIVKNRIKKEKIKDIPSELPSDFAESWQLVTNITGMIDDELCVLIADNFDLKVAEYENPDNDALSLVPERIARKYSVFPIKCTERMLTLATSNPLDQDMINILGFVSSHSINVVIASPNNLSTWITSSYSKFDFNTSGKSDDRHKVGYSINQSEFTPDVNDSVIKEMTVRMLHECYAQDASDIHLEPFAGGGVIRYRIDGLLRQITTLPKTVFEHLAQHIKSNGGMNIATRLVLQDGKSTITINDEAIGLRISAIPVSGGEKIVIRLLKNSIVGSLDTVGLQGQELERFKNIISNQNGIFLMTGPTGSGKSTTLYAAMRELNTYDRCLVAVEDPVEFEVDGIAQVSINPSKKVTFANSLRAFLRQDPDVILVGEIRDEETAEVAMRAALTGHFVLSTLHTNDAISSISRLHDLGISNIIMADALTGLAAQRLLRKLCDKCAAENKSNKSIYEKKYEQLTCLEMPKHPVGCDKCNYTGYRGRVPILELLNINQEFSEAIRNEILSTGLRKIARKSGMRTLVELAKDSIAQGKTSVDEVFRVLGYELLETFDKS